jgi:hypothetical protein
MKLTCAYLGLAMRRRQLAVGCAALLGCVAEAGAMTCAAPVGEPCASNAAPEGMSHTGIAFLDFFTANGNYMPRTHCLLNEAGQTDWPWIAALLVLTFGVVLAYLRIFQFWMRSYFAERKSDRNAKLFDLACIFLLCAICGYVMSGLMFVWPGYRLLAFFLAALNFFSWRFCFNLRPFQKAFAADRLEREWQQA